MLSAINQMDKYGAADIGSPQKRSNPAALFNAQYIFQPA
jgi:hypothetical protein